MQTQISCLLKHAQLRLGFFKTLAAAICFHFEALWHWLVNEQLFGLFDPRALQ